MMTTEQSQDALHPTKASNIRFVKRETGDFDFFTVLKKRVNDYFTTQQIPLNGSLELYAKSAGIGILYVATYAAMMSNQFQGLSFIALFTFMGVLKSLMGFNLTHDALHNAFTPSPFWNRILGHTFDLNGTSSYVWKISHNGKHHTYTNIPGMDDDIEKAITLRFSPRDRLYWFHYFQNWYAPVLYCLTGLYWVFVSDYAWFWNEAKKQGVKKSDIVTFLCFKAVNFCLFILFPLIFLTVPWWQVFVGYLGLQFVGGFMIAIVFQLAHLVEGVQFPEPDKAGAMQNNWAIHEMLTTSNFATDNRWLSFFLGGLNFQIEHHLFPYVSHVHYPEISKIVKNTAREFGIPYNEYPTFEQAVKSHFRLLKLLGRHEIPKLSADKLQTDGR